MGISGTGGAGGSDPLSTVAKFKTAVDGASEGGPAEGAGAAGSAGTPDPITGGMLGQAQQSVQAGQANLSNMAQAQQATTAESANDLTAMSQNIAQGADGKKEPPPSEGATATNDAIAGSTTQA